MTVDELTQLLANYPTHMLVVVDGYEEGYDDLERDLISAKEICLDTGKQW